MNTAKKLLSVLLVLLTLLTLAFIFKNSLTPPEKSFEISESVGDTVAEVIPTDTGVGSFIRLNIRNLAHFAEYGLLGAEIIALIMLLGKFSPFSLICSLGFGLLTALVDETLQIFSNRTSSVVDVWIDAGGYVLFTVLTVALARLISFARTRYILRPTNKL